MLSLFLFKFIITAIIKHTHTTQIQTVFIPKHKIVQYKKIVNYKMSHEQSQNDLKK